jgi:hypothetical protein
MMNWEGYETKGRDRVKVISWHLPGGTEVNHENLSPGRNCALPEYKSGASPLLPICTARSTRGTTGDKKRKRKEDEEDKEI